MSEPSYYPKADICDHCGYSIVELKDGTCPECGTRKQDVERFDLITHRGSTRTSAILYVVGACMWFVLVPCGVMFDRIEFTALALPIVALCLWRANVCWMESKSGQSPKRVQTRISFLSFLAIYTGAYAIFGMLMVIV